MWEADRKDVRLDNNRFMPSIITARVGDMRICLKELRETDVWLQFVIALSTDTTAWQSLRRECNELIAVFVASVKTIGGSDKSWHIEPICSQI